MAKSKILIIEDDPDLRTILVTRLTASGFEVKTAQDGVLAIKEAHSFQPQLIILDLMFPAGGGNSVLRNLKMSNQTSSIPIIVLTAMKNENKKAEVLKLGVAAYLEKPYNPDQLLQEIQRHLSTAN